MLSIKIDSRMKKALKEQAEKEFSPLSTLVKKAIDKYLQDQGIDWREDLDKKPTRAKK